MRASRMLRPATRKWATARIRIRGTCA